jgi:hypothetical protein
LIGAKILATCPLLAIQTRSLSHFSHLLGDTPVMSPDAAILGPLLSVSQMKWSKKIPICIQVVLSSGNG